MGCDLLKMLVVLFVIYLKICDEILMVSGFVDD